MDELICTLLYSDDFVLFSSTFDDMQQLLDVSEAFYQIRALIVNEYKTKNDGSKGDTTKTL